MNRPERKDTLSFDTGDNYPFGYNQACDEWEKWLASIAGTEMGRIISKTTNLPTKEELEEIIASRLDCPDCDNTGAIEPDGDQCEFCHREENSKFNLAQAIHNRINE